MKKHLLFALLLFLAMVMISAQAKADIKPCRETDFGKDFYNKGTLSYDETDIAKTDKCLSETLLNEYWCGDTNAQVSTTYQCPYGCADGACLKEDGEESVIVTTTAEWAVTFYGSTFKDTRGYSDFFRVDNTGDVICHNCTFIVLDEIIDDCDIILSRVSGSGSGEVTLFKDGKVFCSNDLHSQGRVAIFTDGGVDMFEKKVIESEIDNITNIDKTLTDRLAGLVLLQVESGYDDTLGLAWYVDPESGNKFYMQNGERAYEVLENFGLGVSSEDLEKIPIGYDQRLLSGLADSDHDALPDSLEEAIGSSVLRSDTDGDGYSDLDELQNGYRVDGQGKYDYDQDFIDRVGNGILLQVAGDNARGQAWLVKDGKRYYLDPRTAYNAMKYLSLGVSNENIRKIQTGRLELDYK